ncbi:MAG: metallophosphoesterase [Deltaproteobacteria bacterium]|nr:metallophosphoesterase [Deltaproteobacteria bacterium]
MSFFAVTRTLWLIAHVYVGWRLLHRSRLARPWNIVAGVLLGSLLMLGPAAMALGRVPEKPDWMGLVQWAGYLYVGFFLMLLPAVILADFGWGVAAAIRKLRDQGVPEESGPPELPSRRLALVRSVNVGVIAASAIVTGSGFHAARRRPDVVEVDIPLPGLHEDLDGFRIVLLTDIHVGPTIRAPFTETVAEVTDSLKPDLVANTGDLIDGHVNQLRDHVAPLGRITARHGLYYVTGNHEYYWDAPGWVREMERIGYDPLINEHRVIVHGRAKLTVAGATDHSASHRYPPHLTDPAKALEGAPEDSFKLMLAHQPRSAFAAAGAGAQLQLSGHTHGGQFIPWTFLITLFQPVGAGLHRIDGMPIYVSRGTGYWGPPNRAGSPSEITLITLRKT